MTAPRSPVRLGIKTAVVVLATSVALGACGRPGGATAPEADEIRVVTSTTVLADLVAQVGGSKVRVQSLVPKGGEVHTFDPQPSDLADLAQADLIVMNGLGLDDWLAGMATDAGATAPVVRLGDDLPGITYLAGEDGSTTNPHLWLNVAYATAYVSRIAEALAQVAPFEAGAFGDGAAAYEKRLDDLDAWVRGQIATIPEANRAFVMFHDALPYFAAAYGLTIVGTVVDAPGQDPSAGQIADLVDAIRAAGVRAVFSEAQFSPELTKAVAEEAGATVVADLYDDTLGDPPADSYEGIIRWDVDRFAEALR